MRVVGVDPRPEYETPNVEVYSPGELDSLLPDADFVVTTVPHTPRLRACSTRPASV